MKNKASKYYPFKPVKPWYKTLRLIIYIIFGILSLFLGIINFIIFISETDFKTLIFSAIMIFCSVMLFKLTITKNYGVYLLGDRLEFDINFANRIASVFGRRYATIYTASKTVYYKEIQNFYTENMSLKSKFEYDYITNVFYTQGRDLLKDEYIILVAESKKQNRRNTYCFSVKNQKEFLEELQERFNDAQ